MILAAIRYVAEVKGGVDPTFPPFVSSWVAAGRLED